MITYTFGTVIIVKEFDADEYAKQLSIETWGVAPPRSTVKISKSVLKARIYDNTQYTKPDKLLDELGALEEPEEW